MGLRTGGRGFPAAIVLAVALAAASLQLRAEQAVRQLPVTVDVHGRTFLRASTRTLVMTTAEAAVGASSYRAVATIDYVASARTHAGGEVLLAVERGAIRGPGDVASAAARVPVATCGGSERGGEGQPEIAARWVGSGSRRGTIVCTLHAPAPGTYLVPVRLILTAP